MVRSVFISLALFTYFQSGLALEYKDVNMADSREFEKKIFQLNALGLRKVTKYGFSAKIYVAGLYLEKKSSDGEKIIKSKSPKWLVSQFVKNVDKEALQAGFIKAIKKSCLNCKESLEKLKTFNALIPDMREDHQFIMGFFPHKVVFQVIGKKTNQVEIASSAFSKDLLRVYIGPEKTAADKRLRRELLAK